MRSYKYICVVCSLRLVCIKYHRIMEIISSHNMLQCKHTDVNITQGGVIVPFEGCTGPYVCDLKRSHPTNCSRIVGLVEGDRSCYCGLTTADKAEQTPLNRAGAWKQNGGPFFQRPITKPNTTTVNNQLSRPSHLSSVGVR